MSPRYTPETADRPIYRWDYSEFAFELASIHFRRGALMTAMATLGFDVRKKAVLQVLVQDVTKSSEIEGEKLDPQQVRSSIARRLGMECGGLAAPARHVDEVVEMMLDATQHYAQPLSEERLFGRHSSLFPTGHSGTLMIVGGGGRSTGYVLAA